MANRHNGEIRVGIIGTGRIVPRFLAEAAFVDGIKVCCVYNPHRESVDKFTQLHGIDGYSEKVEAFMENIDAVYVATPHQTHYKYVLQALEQGKHVICEKPLVFSRDEAERLFALAQQKQLVLLEGIKTAYCPGFEQIVEVVKSGRIGEVCDVEACFTRLTKRGLREREDAVYGGAFLEFGSYTLLPIIKLMGTEYEKFIIDSKLAENGVDLYTKVYFRYQNGMALSKTGIGVKSEGQLLISGTKGYILAESPWWLTRKFVVRYEEPKVIEEYTSPFLGDGLRYEIEQFIQQIRGRKENMKLLPRESVAMAGIVEKFMEQRY